MGACEKPRILSMSDLEEVVRTKNVSMALHIAENGNFGIGDVLRLQIARDQLNSMKTPQIEERHEQEVDAAIERINAVIDYLQRGEG